jgi:hypothetical protein
MARRLAHLLGVAGLSFASAALADGPNLVLNPGFASSSQNWSGPATWVQTDAHGDPHSGSLRIVNSSQTPGSFLPVTQCALATPGSYVVGISTRVEGTGGDRALVNFGFYSDANCLVPVGTGYNTASSTSASWTTVTALGIAPAGTQRFKVFIDLTRGSAPTGSATGYFDDAFVRTGSCAPSSTQLCLNRGRFEIKVSFQAPSSPPGSGKAVPFSSDSGSFWFFDPTNLELDVKVLDGCALNSRYWVFIAGLTDVGLTITVRDTQTGATKTYPNTQGNVFKTVTDVNAYATCP